MNSIRDTGSPRFYHPQDFTFINEYTIDSFHLANLDTFDKSLHSNLQLRLKLIYSFLETSPKDIEHRNGIRHLLQDFSESFIERINSLK